MENCSPRIILRIYFSKIVEHVELVAVLRGLRKSVEVVLGIFNGVCLFAFFFSVSAKSLTALQLRFFEVFENFEVWSKQCRVATKGKHPSYYVVTNLFLISQ